MAASLPAYPLPPRTATEREQMFRTLQTAWRSGEGFGPGNSGGETEAEVQFYKLSQHGGLWHVWLWKICSPGHVATHAPGWWG